MRELLAHTAILSPHASQSAASANYKFNSGGKPALLLRQVLVRQAGAALTRAGGSATWSTGGTGGGGAPTASGGNGGGGLGRGGSVQGGGNLGATGGAANLGYRGSGSGDPSGQDAAEQLRSDDAASEPPSDLGSAAQPSTPPTSTRDVEEHEKEGTRPPLPAQSTSEGSTTPSLEEEKDREAYAWTSTFYELLTLVALASEAESVAVT